MPRAIFLLRANGVASRLRLLVQVPNQIAMDGCAALFVALSDERMVFTACHGAVTNESRLRRKTNHFSV
jgi:hypothetical protein